MTIPALQPLALYQGDSYSLLLRIKARNNLGDMVYQDLTGAIGKSQIRADASSNTVIAEFTCTITDQVTLTGGVLLQLTPAQTSSIVATVAVWDCEILYANGERHTFLSGPVTITKEVTHV